MADSGLALAASLADAQVHATLALAAARGAGNNGARNRVGPSSLLNITGRGQGVSVAITDRMAAWRRERRVLRWVSRAAWRLEQAERERAWALASARARVPRSARWLPRQRAQLHRRAQHVGPAPELPDERLIARRERKVPDQLSAGRLGKPAQLRQLIL